MSAPIKPARLEEAGSRFWDEIVDSYQLRVDEYEILVDCCREIDLINRLEAELYRQPLVVDGRQGITVASPLVSEVRQHRAVKKTLLAALKLPDTERHHQNTSEKARMAANSRWKTGQQRQTG